MCNRYRVSAKQIGIAQRYSIDPADLMPEPERLPPPELFPKRDGWIVRQESGRRLMEPMHWGVPLNGKPITKVRNRQSPFWRSMLKAPERRCLVPVTSFCEWSGEKGGFTLNEDATELLLFCDQRQPQGERAELVA